MVKLKLAESYDYIRIAKNWPSDFQQNNRPKQYPCIAVIDITPGTMTQELIQVTYVYLSDFNDLVKFEGQFSINQTAPRK